MFIDVTDTEVLIFVNYIYIDYSLKFLKIRCCSIKDEMAVKMFERLFIVIDYTVEKLLLIDKIIVRSLIYRL